MKRAWYDLRKNAKRRGIPCTITLAEFEEFCVTTDYIRGKGRTRTCYSIDRIREFDDEGNVLGYTRDNIRVLTVSDNSKKFHLTKHLRYDFRYPDATRVVTFRPQEPSETDDEMF